MTREALDAGDIQLHIDELVLEGFADLDRQGLDAALQSELARLLSSQEVCSALRKAGQKGVARLDLGQTTIAPSGASSQQLGRELARALLRSITTPAPTAAASAAASQSVPPQHEKGVRR